MFCVYRTCITSWQGDHRAATTAALHLLTFDFMNYSSRCSYRIPMLHCHPIMKHFIHVFFFCIFVWFFMYICMVFCTFPDNLAKCSAHACVRQFIRVEYTAERIAMEVSADADANIDEYGCRGGECVCGR